MEQLPQANRIMKAVNFHLLMFVGDRCYVKSLSQQSDHLWEAIVYSHDTEKKVGWLTINTREKIADWHPDPDSEGEDPRPDTWWSRFKQVFSRRPGN